MNINMNVKPDDFIYLYKVELKPNQQQIGDCYFSCDGKRVTEFSALYIFRHKDDTGCHLLYEFKNGKGTDSNHESIEGAFQEAEEEFGIKKADWEEL